MPIYDYICKSCSHQFDEQHKIVDRKIPTESPCSECGGVVEQLIIPPRIGDPVMLGKHKNSTQFKEVVRKIAEAHPRSPLNYRGIADKYQ